MAVSNQPQGYLCEFMDLVNPEFYCAKCDLVARKTSIISCCADSYCHACIADMKKQAKPCPVCGLENFSIVDLPDHQRALRGARVYCSMKRRGVIGLGN